jgi:hypothetical protein
MGQEPGILPIQMTRDRVLKFSEQIRLSARSLSQQQVSDLLFHFLFPTIGYCNLHSPTYPKPFRRKWNLNRYRNPHHLNRGSQNRCWQR